MEHVDVVIAGAGIAGCQAARDLALAGRSVILMDRKPAEKLGHDWWDAVKVEVFDEVGIPKPERPELMNHNDRVLMYPPLETMSVILSDPPGKLHIDRRLFAQRQLAMAKDAGAKFMEKTRAIKPVLENEKVVGLLAVNDKGETIEIRAKLTIDASGLLGILRRQLPENPLFPRYIDRRDTFVTYREIRERTSDSTESSAVFGKNNGVTWIHRSQDGLVDFFAGAINFPGRANPKNEVREMISKQTDAGEVRRGGYGAPIPVRHCFDAFVAPGFMLCGDSACQCNPIDGSGIASSLRAAHYAAQTANAALEKGSVEIKDLWPYVAKYKRTQGSVFVGFKAVQKFLISEPKTLLELLFARGVISPKDFWGTGEVKQETVFDKLKKLIKIIDKPLFVIRLVKALGTAKELSAHFQEFPEEYVPEEVEKWSAKTRELFARYPARYEDRV